MNKYISLVLIAMASIVMAGLLIRFSVIGPIASGAYRLLLAIPFLLLLAKFLPAPAQAHAKLNKEIISAALLAGLFFALDLAAYNTAILYTSLAEATLLTNLAPFIIAPISIIFFNEKIKRGFIFPVAVAVFGLWLLMYNASFKHNHLFGDCLSLLSALFYALFLIFIKKAASNYSVNRVLIMVGLGGGIILLILAIGFQEVLFPTSCSGWLILITIAITGQVTGQTLLTYGIKFLPLSLSSLLLLLSPLIAAIYAYIIFAEQLDKWQALGIIIVLIAIYWGKIILQQTSRGVP